MRVIIGIMVLFITLSMSGCVGSYAEIGMGYNDNIFGGEDWDNAGAGIFGATLEAGQEWDIPNNPNMNAKCRWLHISQYSAGPPFDDRRESSVDHIGCSIRYKLSEGIF